MNQTGYRVKRFSAKENIQRNLDQLTASKRTGDSRWLEPGYLTRLNLKGQVCAAFVVALAASTRLERPGFDKFVAACKSDKPALIAAWHGSMIVASYCFRSLDVVLMTSHSVDGDIIGRIAVALGYHLVRGSSSRGGMRGLLEMIKLLQNGKNGSLTVDGPRGPRHEVKPGVVMMARKTGARIVPVGVAYSKVVRINNWDKTEVPLPGSRVVMQCGTPFALDKNISLEASCKLVKQRIHACEDAAANYIATGCLSDV